MKEILKKYKALIIEKIKLLNKFRETWKVSTKVEELKLEISWAKDLEGEKIKPVPVLEGEFKGIDISLKILCKSVERSRHNTKGYPRELFRGELNRMFNCCGMVILTDAVVNFNGMGMGTLLLQLAKDIAEYLGYSSIACTTKDRYDITGALKKAGFKLRYSWENGRTLNDLEFYTCDLDYLYGDEI